MHKLISGNGNNNSDMRETDQSYTQNYSNENAAIANIPSADNGDADELANNPMAAAIAAAALAAQRIRDRISGGLSF